MGKVTLRLRGLFLSSVCVVLLAATGCSGMRHCHKDGGHKDGGHKDGEHKDCCESCKSCSAHKDGEACGAHGGGNAEGECPHMKKMMEEKGQ